MSTDQTSEALAAITDEGLFERLASAVLRNANAEYRSLTHPGVNAAGKTVKSPVDGICFVPGSDRPHFVAVHHTITDREWLQRKWLHDPSTVKRRKHSQRTEPPGDVLKTAQIVAEAREKTPQLLATLVLTTNQEPDEELVRSVELTARTFGMSIDLWTRSRFAHFLDNEPSGQWLRHSFLGIDQEQLSVELLRSLSEKSVAIHRPHDDPAAWIPRQLDAALGTITQLTDVTFLVASSGMGKSVACHRALAAHVRAGGAGLVLPHEAVASALTLEHAITNALRELHPALASLSPSACSFCSADEPLLLVVEDINRSGKAQALLERLAGWSRGVAPFATDRRPLWRLVCPVWPEVLATLPEQVRRRLDELIVFADGFTPAEGREAVLARARVSGRELSAVSAEALSAALGNDPLLIALHEYRTPPDPLRIIADYVDSVLTRSATSAREYSAGDFRSALRGLADAMLANRQLAPSWRDIAGWLGAGDVRLRLLARLAHDGELIRFIGDSDTQHLSFRHDRVRDWLLADALSDSEHHHALPEQVLADPYLAEVVGTVVALGCSSPEFLARVQVLNPLALLYALRLFGRAHKPTPAPLQAAITKWLQDPATHTAVNDEVRWAALAILADTDSPDVPAITRTFGDRTLTHQLARLRNGDTSGGIELCSPDHRSLLSVGGQGRAPAEFD